ncbi:MAG: Uncharacterised protein [Cellulomonadaceae bacterium TMED98]|nr:MAG: Uncharacterised protein [Cellulomonadaceae bacterium TMED98]
MCGDDGARFDDIGAFWHIPNVSVFEHVGEGPDAIFDFCLFVFRSVIPAVFFEVAFFPGHLNAFGNVGAAFGGQLLQFQGKPVVGLLGEPDRLFGLRHHVLPPNT